MFSSLRKESICKDVQELDQGLVSLDPKVLKHHVENKGREILGITIHGSTAVFEEEKDSVVLAKLNIADLIEAVPHHDANKDKTTENISFTVMKVNFKG